MRPQRIISCILWIFVIGLSVNLFYYLIIPLLFFEDRSENSYSNMNRDVKEWKTGQTPLKLSLLDKLLSQFVDVGHFDPDPIAGPIPLIRRNAKSSIKNKSIGSTMYNYNVVKMNSSDLLKLEHQINDAQEILNKNMYPYPEYVIVIQIHNRLEYLTILINCLLNIKDIHKALLVFSHDMYYSEFNTLIRSIKFAPVVQIFFPFNQQVFKSQFPGPSSKDCNINIKKNSPEAKNCFNSAWSDTYGNYRNYKYTQTKHHWAWKANFVFERLHYLKDYEKYVVFIEEDHFLTEDFLHVLQLMIEEKKKKYQSISILSLGTYEKSYSFDSTPKIQTGDWMSSFHNMGMTFDRSFWLNMKKCSKAFCEFDDYNWDWSLNHVSKRCANSVFQVMLLKNAPRIFHIGECGIHHKKKVCNPYVILYKIQKTVAQNIQYLYPNELSYNGVITVRVREFKPNGGWSDLRDRELCKVLLTNSPLFDNITSLEASDSRKSVIESILL